MPFWLHTETPVPELIVRGTAVFFILLALIRITGERESGGLGLSDLMVIVLIGSAAADAMTGGGTTVLDGVIPAATILFWSVVVDAVTYRWPRLQIVLKGRPKALITNGRLDRRALRREFISIEELRSQLRIHGLTDFSQVRKAYLEPNGSLSIISDGDGRS